MSPEPPARRTAASQPRRTRRRRRSLSSGENSLKTAFALDPCALRPIAQERGLALVDHRDPNHLLENPTAENRLVLLFEKLEGAHSGLKRAQALGKPTAFTQTPDRSMRPLAGILACWLALVVLASCAADPPRSQEEAGGLASALDSGDAALAPVRPDAGGGAGPEDASAPLDAGDASLAHSGTRDAGRTEPADAEMSLPADAALPANPDAATPAIDWHDYLVQDTCRSGGVPVSGDPYSCPEHSDLQPGERVHASFKYASSARDMLIHSLPRASPHGKTAFVWFDSGNNANGKGTFDLDDPHCKVPSTLCETSGDVDIVDLDEAHWDGPWFNIVSAMATANLQTGGYLAFTTSAPDSTAGSWPDAWLFGVNGTADSSAIGLSVYRDSAGHIDTYSRAQMWNRNICSTPLGQVPPTCTALGYNQWLVANSVYMGENKTFQRVIISMHTVDHDTLASCVGHLELYLHSREYGLMSHQTWRAVGCDSNPSANIGCSDNEKSMVVSPMSYYFGTTSIQLQRKACLRTVTNGPEYVYDPRALSQPSRVQPYPNALVVDDVGYGNILMNPHFSWTDTGIAGWSAYDALTEKVVTGAGDVARYNDAAEVWCNGDCAGSSIYQDVDLDGRAPSLKGNTVDFGARVAHSSGTPAGGGSLYLWQYHSDWTANGQTSVAFTASDSWPSPTGTFVTGTAVIKSDTRFIRYQVYVNNAATRYVVDDTFVTRAN